MPRLSIIIPTKDRPEILEQSLSRAVEAVEGIDVEIIVINDSEHTLPGKFARYGNVKIFNNRGKGVATARNFGSDVAKSDLLLFLDDDMWISKENIINYLDFNSKYPDGILNLNWIYPEYLRQRLDDTALGRYLKLKDYSSMKGWNKGNIWNDNELFESSGVAGANLFLSKGIYKKLKGYDASFPFAGFEDYDISHRLKEAGIKCYVNPNSMMYHNEANKLELKGWLIKNYNSAVTNKHAVSIGYNNLKPKRSIFRRMFYFFTIPFSPILIKLSILLSDNKKFDKINFKLISLLTGLYMYRGYNQF